MKRPKFQSPTGMHDVLPGEQAYFQKILGVAESIVASYGFQKISTPIVEELELFARGIGGSTDIVEKQMYTLKTRGGDLLALRPEGTASIVRSYIEHGMFNLPQPLKLWYEGPFFRYEKPQAGRFRQFHQFGVEVFGEDNPVIDAQVIQIFYNILKDLKFDDLVIEINSIGDSQCKPYFRKLLVSYFNSREQSLCSDCIKRLRESPLRILDCKEEKCQRIISQAPQIIDHLCEECHDQFKEVLEFLDEAELPYHLNPYLVRGLDYYTKTVFEIFSKPSGKSEEESMGRQDALAGGGRYDNLVRVFGGKDTPACGGAAGIERIIGAMKARSIRPAHQATPKIFMAQLGDLAKRKSLKLFEEFRKAKISVAESFSKDSLKTQLRIADKVGVDYALIIGQKEALDGMVIIRKMDTGTQETVKVEKVVEVMKKKLRK